MTLAALARIPALALAVAILAVPALAQDGGGWPARPITIVVPAAAGGSADVTARLVAEPMSVALGQRVVVENRAGAGGLVGAGAVAQAAPDGYTLLLGNIGPNAISVSLHKTMPYDNARAFAPITLLTTMPNVLVTKADSPFNSMSELVAYAREPGRKVEFASAGAGQSQHLAGELLKTMAGVPMTHVPYRGAGPALNDLIAGHVTIMFDNLASSLPHVRSGALKALAVTSAARLPVLPDVPTVAEAGFPGFEVTAWFGLLAPAGTPPAVVERLNREARAALRDPRVVERLAALGATGSPTAPGEFAAFIAAETAKWADVVAKANLEKM